MSDGGRKFFPLMCQLDDKFELIEAAYGLKGFAIVVKLFQKIYGGDGGYYCKWSEEIALLFSRKQCGLMPGNHTVSDVVDMAIKRDIFHGPLYERYQILTSRGIQERYLKMSVRQRHVEMLERYLLLDVTEIPANVDIMKENVTICAENAYNSIQIKEKETKRNEKQIKEEVTKDLFTKEQCSHLNEEGHMNDTVLNQEKGVYTKDNKGVKKAGCNTVVFDEYSFERQTALFLRTKVLEILPKQTVPKNEGQIQKWAAVIGQMKRLDGFSEKEISELLEFAVADAFWRTNIRSAGALREKRETLMAQMVQKKLMSQREKPKQNRFVNYTQRQWDFEEIERLEKENLRMDMQHYSSQSEGVQKEKKEKQ